MNNLTGKPVIKNAVLVKIGDLIPVRTINPITSENWLVIDIHKKFITCDNGTGIEKIVIFVKSESEDRCYFQETN